MAAQVPHSRTKDRQQAWDPAELQAVPRHEADIYQCNITAHVKLSGGLPQAQLARVMFPLAPLTKDGVRALAAAAQLPTQARRDSQGICFLGKVGDNCA